ncbi:hypothetical protein IJG79_02825 [Candidatus Saccharibacteria bacterium]|nr:hypothetical protein [Candidatus Saccharibacteria bacterium]
MKKSLKYIIIGLAGILFASMTLLLISNSDKTSVEIRVAPADAKILIDGKEYKNGTYQLPIGEKQIHIEFGNDFVSQDYSINIPKSNEPYKLYNYLVQRDGSTSWYDTHESDAILLNTIGDYLAGKQAEQYLNNYPIINKLPIIVAQYDKEYNYTEYRIDGGKFEQCKADFCLKITDTTGGNLEAAKQKITNLGYNLSDFEIIYEYKPIKQL